MAQPNTILINNYNNVDALLSGESLLAQLDYMDSLRYVPVVVFNRECAGARLVRSRGHITEIIKHGGGWAGKRLLDYSITVNRLHELASRFNASLLHADNIMAARPLTIVAACKGIPLLVHLRNIAIPARCSFVMKSATRFAAVSSAVVKGVVPSSRRGDAEVVYDGLDLNEYSAIEENERRRARARFGIDEGEIAIGMAGRLSPQKGQDVFIRAAALLASKCGNVVFRHAGGVPTAESSDSYERHVHGLSLALAGQGVFQWLPYCENMREYWGAMDIAVVPSAGPEAFGRVIIEAMAMGKPVISTRTGGPEEILEPSCGILIQPGSASALAEAMEVLVHDGVARGNMGYEGCRRVGENYSASAYAQKMMRLYDLMLAK